MQFKGKRILITGGTGSCGHQLTERLLAQQPKEIRIFSRDEKKHYDMQHELRRHPEVTFIIGDVRDAERVSEAMHGVDIVFNAAAMKHVTQCERNAIEAVKTNIHGTRNVIEAALRAKVERVIQFSTDKACEPVNIMGMTKAVAERLIVDANSSPHNEGTKLCVVRYGNVMASRGSVIPYFRKLVGQGAPIPVTDERMTRFMITLGEAIDLVLYAAAHTKGGEIFIKKAPAVRILDLAQALSEEKKAPFKHTIVGAFPGEKLAERLVSNTEMSRTTEQEGYYIIQPNGERKSAEARAYSSDDALITLKEIPALIARGDADNESASKTFAAVDEETYF